MGTFLSTEEQSNDNHQNKPSVDNPWQDLVNTKKSILSAS